MIEMLNRKVEFISVYLLKKKRVVARECIIIVNKRENVASEVVQRIIKVENGENKKKGNNSLYLFFYLIKLVSA